MTEAEWLTSNDSNAMLRSLMAKWRSRAKRTGAKVNTERLRLFACACCRRVWHLLDDDHHRSVSMIEEYADAPQPGGLRKARAVRREAAKVIKAEAARIRREQPLSEGANFPALAAGSRTDAASAVWKAAEKNPISAANCARRVVIAMSTWGLAEFVRTNGEITRELWQASGKRFHAAELTIQASILRDVVGNPFRDFSLASPILTWNNATIPKIAAAIYADRAFGNLPILADALEEAGCDNADILTHCRSGGEHVRGCWVVDLILGKS